MAKWEPDLAPKQVDVYRSSARTKVAVGPRYTGKTWAFEHLVFQHCWRHQARFAIVPKTTRVSKSGVWPELVGTIYDEWKAAGICSQEADFGWAKAPWTDPVTKILMAEVWNRHGTTSQIQVFPIQFEREAADKVFSTQFSGFWLSEAHLWPTDAVYKLFSDQVRLPGVPYEDQLILLDANPPDEGKKHWLYRQFVEPEELPEDLDPEQRAHVEYERGLTRIWQFMPEDNPKGDQKVLRGYAARYANDPRAFKRFVRGEWLDGVEAELLFNAVWAPNRHVFGDASSPHEEEWEVLVPSNGVHVERHGGRVQLLGGWDPGDKNHAWAAIQPWVNAKGKVCFDVLDELVVVGGVTKTREFTKSVMERRATLGKLAESPVAWEDFSDSSVDRFRASAENGEDTDAAIIEAESRGEIRLQSSGAVKKKEWQKRRVDFLAELLAQDRIRVSAHCTWTQRMFEKLRKDMAPKPKTYIAGGQDEKHIFDAISYPIAMRCVGELLDESRPTTKARIYGY
jgi:hypothetical protein